MDVYSIPSGSAGCSGSSGSSGSTGTSRTNRTTGTTGTTGTAYITVYISIHGTLYNPGYITYNLYNLLYEVPSWISARRR